MIVRTPPEHRTPPGPGPAHQRTHHRKREDLGKAEKPVYICMIADDEKSIKKVKKKFGNKKKGCNFASEIKQQTSLINKITKQ